MILFLILITVILLLGSAFCSSSEAALFSISKSKIETKINQGNRRAKILLKAKENISQSIGAIVITNNLFNIVGTLIVGVIAGNVFDSTFAIGAYSIILTLLVILFGEILPKNFGERFNLSYALAVTPIIALLTFVFKPLLFALDKSSRLIFGKPKPDKVTEEELKLILAQSHKHQAIETKEHKLINNVFSLNDKTAEEIMTPRVHIYYLDADLSLEEQKEKIFNSQHSRLPVFCKDKDNILGFVLTKEVISAFTNNRQTEKPEAYLKEIIRVNKKIKVDSLLFIFQKKKVHIALATDEFNGTSGIVTLEDVLEELVGEIVDETDQVVDMREHDPNQVLQSQDEASGTASINFA